LVTKPGKKVRISLDISQSLVKEIDAIRETIGVDRGALIKVWLYDRVRQEKSAGNHQV
jgi:metal-responsive CopG/Arc/MetJ family transcriptional regulator